MVDLVLEGPFRIVRLVYPVDDRYVDCCVTLPSLTRDDIGK